MAVPYTFGTATAAIPLSQLDSNFATAITIGNTAVQLGNTITALANVSLVNATVTSLASPITAAQGGTGLTTLTSNNVVLGNGTGNVLLVAPGTSGNALVSNGTTWSSSAVSANVSTVTGVLPIANGGTGTSSTTYANLATNVTGTLPVANGGTGLTSTPANGALDIGNGTGFTRTTLTAGSGITVTNASGSITIASSAASGLTLITTLTASNSASLTFTNTSITSTYDIYLFVFSSLKAAVGNSNLFLETSTDNGATFATTAGNYDYQWAALDTASLGWQNQASTTATAFAVGYLLALGSSAGRTLNGQIYMSNPLKAADRTQFVGQLSAYPNSRGATAFGGGTRTTAEANNAIKFYFDSGDMTSGTIQIFGVQK